ncbi:hypothetical protein KCV01_g10631, partial [Aureobasidium melanogenum]
MDARGTCDGPPCKRQRREQEDGDDAQHDTLRLGDRTTQPPARKQQRRGEMQKENRALREHAQRGRDEEQRRRPAPSVHAPGDERMERQHDEETQRHVEHDDAGERAEQKEGRQDPSSRPSRTRIESFRQSADDPYGTSGQSDIHESRCPGGNTENPPARVDQPEQ